MPDTNGSIGLEGRWVKLRPPAAEDLPMLYQWRNDPTTLYLWSRRRELLSWSAFLREIEADERDGLLRLVVEDKSGELVGLVFAYNLSIFDRHCYIGTYIRPDRRGIGYGVEATALFLRYLFTYLGLVKVYATVYEFNHLSRSTLESAGFRLEGTFPRDHEWGGQWWTTYQFALYREDLQRIEKLLARLNWHGGKDAGDSHLLTMTTVEKGVERR